MLKGMTAEYLLRRTYPVKKGDMVLNHAAAGGVGLILGQWANHLGATRDRHGRLARKGRTGQGALGLTHHVSRLFEGRFLCAPEVYGADPRGRGPKLRRGLRCGGQGHVPGLARLLSSRAAMVRSSTVGKPRPGTGGCPPFPMTLLSQKGSLICHAADFVSATSRRARNCEESASALSRPRWPRALSRSANQPALRAGPDAAKAHDDLEGTAGNQPGRPRVFDLPP